MGCVSRSDVGVLSIQAWKPKLKAVFDAKSSLFQPQSLLFSLSPLLFSLSHILPLCTPPSTLPHPISPPHTHTHTFSYSSHSSIYIACSPENSSVAWNLCNTISHSIHWPFTHPVAYKHIQLIICSYIVITTGACYHTTVKCERVFVRHLHPTWARST